MKLLYPGSFNPFHIGHLNIYKKASKLGIVELVVPIETTAYAHNVSISEFSNDNITNNATILVRYFNGLLIDLVNKIKPDAIVRGLRNGNDLQYEMNMQYWNEDLGIEIPTIYFICDRRYSHISSSSIREFNKYKKEL